jgi:hypothetical protein
MTEAWGNQDFLAPRGGGAPSAEAQIGRRPIRALVATVYFKLVRTRISIGWLFLSNAGIPHKSYHSLLFSAVVFLPLFINTKHNDVGGDAHVM